MPSSTRAMNKRPPQHAALVRAAPLAVTQRAVDALQPNPNNPRTHSAKQIEQIAKSIATFGFSCPILIGAQDRVIAGHGRLEAARQLGMAEVPTINLAHLSPAEQRAFALAENRMAELAGWDRELLQIELKELDLLAPEISLETLGWEGAELDTLLFPEPAEPDAEPPVPELQTQAVTRTGDLWLLGSHRLLCGDAREPDAYAALLQGEAPRMVFTDPPYNLPVRDLGRDVSHREFVAGSGEMSAQAFLAFLTASLAAMAAACMPGAILFACMDWRHIGQLLTAGENVGLELKNLAVWAKPVAGLGQFYRSQHELISVFKRPGAAHLDTFGMGKGRSRSNLWSYPGLNAIKPGRKAELELHPTVKNSALIADAIKDVSRRGELVLDPFAGSGSTLIAAEKVHRKARLIELDPLYCDVICRRFEAFSGMRAMLAKSREDFTAVQARRAAEIEVAGS